MLFILNRPPIPRNEINKHATVIRKMLHTQTKPVSLYCYININYYE